PARGATRVLADLRGPPAPPRGTHARRDERPRLRPAAPRPRRPRPDRPRLQGHAGGGAGAARELPPERPPARPVSPLAWRRPPGRLRARLPPERADRRDDPRAVPGHARAHRP